MAITKLSTPRYVELTINKTMEIQDSTPETKVVFRKLNENNDVVALFPEIIWGSSYHIAYYMHVGQHGAGDYDWFISNSTPATEQEYKPLLDELTDQVGYQNLRIMKKCRPKFN